VATQVRAAFWAAASLWPLFREATTKLAASRLTSHSQGAGSVLLAAKLNEGERPY
jgi:hypothetical protein